MNDDTIVDDGPEMSCCVGPTSTSLHKFLMGDGTYECIRCNSIMCQHCWFTMDDDESSFCCVACHSLMLVGTGIQEGEGPTLEEMRCQLVSHTILEGQTEDTSLKIEDLYDAYIMRKHNKLYCDKTVQFPKEPSKILNHGKLEMIHTFEFQEGGQLLHAENITDKHQQDIRKAASQP